MMKTLFFSCLLLGLVSCASTQKAAHHGELTGVVQSRGQFSEAEGQFFEDSSIPTVERKIVKSAWVNLTVDDVDSVRSQLVALAQSYQGYVQQGELYSISLRLKNEFLDQALAQVETLGKVTQRTIRTEDVTDRYFDLETRISSLETTHARYLALLEKAYTVSDILPIEKELERITQELESLKGQQQRLSDQVAYSTIAVTLSPKIKPGPIGYLGVGVYKVVKWLFVRN